MKKILVAISLLISPAIYSQSLQMIENSWTTFDQDMDSAIHLVEKGYRMAQQEGNLKAMGRALSYRAIFYDINGKADSALFLFYKALPIQESILDTQGLVTTYNNMGIFNFSQYQFPQAMFYYKKAYQTAMLLNDYSSAAGSLVNMGVIESYQPEGGKALEYYDEAEKLYLKAGDTTGLFPIWSNKAKIYLDRGEYQIAYKYNLKSVCLNDDLKSMSDWLTERILMTNILGKMKKWSEAEKYGLEGLKVAEESHMPERRQYIYEALSNIYFGMGNYKKAYEFSARYRDLRDSLINDSRAAQVAEMQVKYEDEKKNNEISKLKLEAAEKKNVELQKKRLQSRVYWGGIVGGIGFIILVALVLLLVIAIRLEKKNAKLQLEKKLQTETLLEQEKILMRESHHRIKNNLQLVNSILDLQSRSITDPEAKRIFAESRKRIQAISFAHQRLHGNDTVEKLDLKNFLDDLIQSIQSASLDENSPIIIQSNIEYKVISTEKAVPIGLIVNELFTNALKYAFPNRRAGKIDINLRSIGNKIELIIRDNGVGMPSATDNGGFGHQLVKSMIRQLKSEYFLSLDSGVEHKFLIPVS